MVQTILVFLIQFTPLAYLVKNNSFIILPEIVTIMDNIVNFS